MKTPAAPCTMRDIAVRLSLSVMTVSRALRDTPGVDAGTRRDVRNMAEKLGYRPDPTLAVLNAYRHGRRARPANERIAFLVNFPHPTQWKKVGTFRRYYESAAARATELGYALEPFWLGDPQLKPRRASTILRERGIRGVLVGPLAQGQSALALEWDWFSAVALGRSLTSPGLTTVSTNHFQVTELAWREAEHRKFQRIGLALTEHEDARTLGALRAAHLLQQSRADDERLPVFIAPTFSKSRLAEWLRQARPDVLLSSEQAHYDLVDARARRSLAFIHLNVNPDSMLAGIDQGHEEVGAQAAALLHLKLIQRQTGVPARANILMVEGKWQEGCLYPVARHTPASERVP